MSAVMTAAPSTSSISTTTNLFARPDTSICSHLASVLESSSGAFPAAPASYETANGAVPPPGPKLKKHDVEKRFTETVRWGAVAEGAKRRKTSSPECHTCSSTLTRPWACLTCPYIGCLPFSGVSSSSSTKDCMRSHWQRSDGSCGFAVDPSSGAIYCSSCSDTIYPDQFESIFRTVRIRTEEMHDKSREPGVVGGGRGRGRGPWKAWNPSNMVKIQESEVEKSSCRGLRPLLNLSQTCFLSAILQSLIHNPLLKAYFLSDKHNRHVCPNGSKGLSGCMCCEMDRAFEEFYNEDKSPYGPITMLYAMWHASAELEGYGQQDAHSFFLAALDQIHAHAKGQLSSCNCIAHQTFSGQLLSSVTCSSCSHTSSTIDPILDIQLDFPTSTSSSEGISAGNQLTLAGLLRRFCANENIGETDGSGKGFECSKCGGGPGTYATKNLTIKKLAPVLSFQLKRFAHMTSSSSKIESHVKFPSTLNMRPYVDSPNPTSFSSNQSVSEDIKPNIDEDKEAEDHVLPDSLFLYDLFAVVTHEGKLDNGHYWADVREGEEWWHCDDDKVTPTTLSAVLSQKAYMLFYVKRSLAYAQPMSKLLSTTAPAASTTNASSNTNTNSSTAPIPPVLNTANSSGNVSTITS
uniref:Ubiquitin carboxyl-terminal hydrolase 22/27/51 n=1 Tax=Kwoniella dejecticola CBS 10117 TaxID=1296121 RepID=A0A1A5ZTM6_9TREE|nr:ubiquitin carboxyl-terminal hydrolase 22/27/51 [Kwoniella dejecticola CBS 10117]OBR81171.1 ubiquitin carboxyl-terminal hydrolase 22/27/51 [Kwoniella dejecticola CBS 10117]